MVFNFATYWPALLLLLGVVGLVFKNKITDSLASVGTIFGLKKQYVLVGFAVAGIIFGGFALVMTMFSGTASIVTDSNIATTQSALISCAFASAPTEAVPGTDNVTFNANTKDLSKNDAQVQFDNGGKSINGSLRCESNRADISKGAQADCYLVSDSYRSETSTTDSNVYYWLSTSTSASKVPGLAWAQTAYLADEGSTNIGASTSDSVERTKLVFAQDEAVQYLGYYITIADATSFGYLNNQSSGAVKFICDGAQVGELDLTKVASI